MTAMIALFLILSLVAIQFQAGNSFIFRARSLRSVRPRISSPSFLLSRVAVTRSSVLNNGHDYDNNAPKPLSGLDERRAQREMASKMRVRPGRVQNRNDPWDRFDNEARRELSMEASTMPVKIQKMDVHDENLAAVTTPKPLAGSKPTSLNEQRELLKEASAMPGMRGKIQKRDDRFDNDDAQNVNNNGNNTDNNNVTGLKMDVKASSQENADPRLFNSNEERSIQPAANNAPSRKWVGGEPNYAEVDLISSFLGTQEQDSEFEFQPFVCSLIASMAKSYDEDIKALTRNQWSQNEVLAHLRAGTFPGGDVLWKLPPPWANMPVSDSAEIVAEYDKHMRKLHEAHKHQCLQQRLKVLKAEGLRLAASAQRFTAAVFADTVRRQFRSEVQRDNDRLEEYLQLQLKDFKHRFSLLRLDLSGWVKQYEQQRQQQHKAAGKLAATAGTPGGGGSLAASNDKAAAYTSTAAYIAPPASANDSSAHEQQIP